MRNMATVLARHRPRYAYTRGGTYRPKPKQYKTGGFVYVKRRSTNTLDCSVSPVIMQIIRIKSDYALVLRGRDRRVINDHARNTAPCYLPDVSDEFVPARVVPEADHRCEIWHRIDSPFTMLLCDECNMGYHMECLTPPLTEVPPREWYCPNHPDVPANRAQ